MLTAVRYPTTMEVVAVRNRENRQSGYRRWSPPNCAWVTKRGGVLEIAPTWSEWRYITPAEPTVAVQAAGEPDIDQDLIQRALEWKSQMEASHATDWHTLKFLVAIEAYENVKRLTPSSPPTPTASSAVAGETDDAAFDAWWAVQTAFPRNVGDLRRIFHEWASARAGAEHGRAETVFTDEEQRWLAVFREKKAAGYGPAWINLTPIERPDFSIPEDGDE